MARHRTGRPRSPKAAAITRAIKSGDSDSAIAARLSVSRSTVREYRRRLGVPAFSPGENTPGALAARKSAAHSNPKPDDPAHAPATIFGLLSHFSRSKLAESPALLSLPKPTHPSAIGTAGERQSAPALGGARRLMLTGCGHIVVAVAGDDVGRIIACGPCGGTHRPVARLLASSEPVFG